MLNCTTMGALIGTSVLLFWGLVCTIIGATVSVVEPVVKLLWNSGTVWFPVTSVTTTVNDALADRATAGVNVSDNPSFDNARVPTMLFTPWNKDNVPVTATAG